MVALLPERTIAAGIRNVGSISKALKRLVADEIIYEFNGEYLFENPFFREWVRRR